jgi:hypothetical protein
MGATQRYGWYLAALQWLPTLCWSVAGAALLSLAAAHAKRWLSR